MADLIGDVPDDICDLAYVCQQLVLYVWLGAVKNRAVPPLAAFQVMAHGVACTIFLAVRNSFDNRTVLFVQLGDVVFETGILSGLRGCAWDDAATDHRQEFQETRVIGRIGN